MGEYLQFADISEIREISLQDHTLKEKV